MLSIISQERLRTSRNLLVTAVLAVAACALYAAYQASYLEVVINQDLPISYVSRDLGKPELQNAVAEGKYMYVTAHGDEIMENVIEETVQRRRRSSKTYYYYVLAAGENALLVKSTNPYIDGTSFTGVLHKNKTTISSLVTAQDTGNRELLPFYLEVNGHSEFPAYLLLFAALVSGTVLLWAIMRFARQDLHHLSKAVREKGYEHASPLDPGQLLEVGHFIVTPELLMKKNPFSTSVVDVKDITWAYMELQKKKAYFVIPVGTKAYLNLHTEEEKHRFEEKSEVIDAILKYLHERNPEMKIGHEIPTEEEEDYK